MKCKAALHFHKKRRVGEILGTEHDQNKLKQKDYFSGVFYPRVLVVAR